MNRRIWQAYCSEMWAKIRSAAIWIFFGILCGLAVGAAGAALAKGVVFVTDLRFAHPWLIFCLPVGGIAIVWLYQRGGEKALGGTNRILENIRNLDRVPARIAPLIFVSTVITHLFGGSAGREGAALQMGGSLGNTLARILHFNKKDRRRAIICGMSAAFSALFGTPLAAVMLPMEMSTVGIVYYSALVPCVFSSLTAYYVRTQFGIGSAQMFITNIPALTIHSILITCVFAILCALVSVLFCSCLGRAEHILAQRIPNNYLKTVLTGAVIIVLTFLVGDQTYNGTGTNIIASCLTDSSFRVVWYAFLLKILFTVITLSGEYKGGEIVPSLFIGAVLGNAFAWITGYGGIDQALFSAIGMGCLFCGVTNCPIASLLICFEMFGFDGMPYYLIAIALTYVFSGNFGVYKGQKILYSKFAPEEINAYTHD